MSDEKNLGADAAAVDTTRSAEAVPQLSHATPGPWQIDREEFDDGDGKQIPVVSRDGYGITDVRHWSGKPENWANAHLIAAAPELLREVQALMDFVHAKRGACWSGTDTDRVKAVIAKAEGRS